MLINPAHRSADAVISSRYNGERATLESAISAYLDHPSDQTRLDVTSALTDVFYGVDYTQRDIDPAITARASNSADKFFYRVANVLDCHPVILLRTISTIRDTRARAPDVRDPFVTLLRVGGSGLRPASALQSPNKR